MESEEAQAWLRGERSMTNILMDIEAVALDGDHDRQQTLVRIEVADAAKYMQAYCTLKARKEELI